MTTQGFELPIGEQGDGSLSLMSSEAVIICTGLHNKRLMRKRAPRNNLFDFTSRAKKTQHPKREWKIDSLTLRPKQD